LEKAVPGYDEDVITMAIEAGAQVISSAGIDRAIINSLYLGTTSPPYEEHPCSSTVAVALGIAPEVHAVDVGGSPRSGTSALLSCLHHTMAKGDGIGLAVASDRPIARPEDSIEHGLGAGAVALLIGKGNAKAVLEGYYSIAQETLGERFRREGSPYVADLELRSPSFEEALTHSLRGLMEGLGLAPRDIDHLVLQQPDGRSPARAMKALAFSQEQLELGNLASLTGDTASCSTLLGLCRILDRGEANQRVILVSYGGGATALSFLLQPEVSQREESPLERHLEEKEYIDYTTYLKFKGLLGSSTRNGGVR
jgi:hydroxymethylglutaryl-CoA synthase